ncbi:MAG TPA: GNAT family N-acetyltransferase [Paucimonas sp.]|nr:GNAT family N-acetyltransferase [Paucimonas sp.]
MSELPTIETDRTVLRLLLPDQAQLLVDYQLDNRAHLAPWEPLREESFYSLEAARRRIEDGLQAFADGRAVHFAVFARDSRHDEPDAARIIALCNFSNIVRGVFQACHLGYSIGHAYQGRGLMREVARAGIGYMFHAVGLHRVMANYMPSNERSARLLRKLGFEREGYARAYLKIAGKWEDHVLTALINPALAD